MSLLQEERRGPLAHRHRGGGCARRRGRLSGRQRPDRRGQRHAGQRLAVSVRDALTRLRGGVPPTMIEAAGRPDLDLRAAVGDERIRERVRVAVFCLLLAALPLDLAINPARFLARALTLWDPTQFGQLQNQAVGYLFPMGPFFALGRLIHLDPWVIQRLWIALVLIAAFLGTVALAGRLGIGTPRTRILGGLSYAMSPIGLSLLGVLSAQFLPAAMLPWVLLPLAGPAVRGGRGHARAAAQSAAAVAACG